MDEAQKYKPVEGGITAPSGFHASGVSCGLKNGGYKDIGLLVSDTVCDGAAAFTDNKVKASPVLLDMERMSNKISAVIVNSGNANCLNGEQGDKDALRMAELTEQNLKLKKGSVLVASTGVIGEALNMGRVEFGINKLCEDILRKDNYQDFSHSIMTTDSRAKNSAYEFVLNGKKVKIGATAKGAGMIKPQVNVLHATMLVFISTDARIAKHLLDKALAEAVKYSFNRISVDNDTSTNDSVILLANGMAKNPEIVTENEDFQLFSEVLLQVCQDIAKMIVKDGEGASKVVHIVVKNAMTATDAEKVARAVADSYLVKTAIFGSSPNWGRIMAAVGYSGAKFDLNRMKLYINHLEIFSNGIADRANVARATSEMIPNELQITLDLGLGSKEFFLWTSDLTYDYVKINAHYIS